MKSEDELNLIQQHGVSIIRPNQILRYLRNDGGQVKAAAGSDLLELMHITLAEDSNGQRASLSEVMDLAAQVPAIGKLKRSSKRINSEIVQSLKETG